MTSNPAINGRGRVDTTEFTPMVIDGEQHGDVQFIRDDTNHGRINRAAVWRLTEDQVPYVSPYEFRNDETILVLEGELHITFDDGTTTTITEGDIISIMAGTKTDWRIDKPFKKYVVETGN